MLSILKRPLLKKPLFLAKKPSVCLFTIPTIPGGAEHPFAPRALMSLSFL